jgi:hypothetical protein
MFVGGVLWWKRNMRSLHNTSKSDLNSVVQPLGQAYFVNVILPWVIHLKEADISRFSVRVWWETMINPNNLKTLWSILNISWNIAGFLRCPQPRRREESQVHRHKIKHTPSLKTIVGNREYKIALPFQEKQWLRHGFCNISHKLSSFRRRNQQSTFLEKYTRL